MADKTVLGSVQPSTLHRVLVARWKREIRQLSPSQRERWLKSQDAIIALGARQCEQLRQGIRDGYDRMSKIVPGGEWLEAWFVRHRELPVFTADKGRRHAVRMQLGQGMVRFGDGGTPHRRWTPPQSVGEEDLIDRMGDLEALFHPHPPSPSAMAIYRICVYGRSMAIRIAKDRPRK